MEGHTEGFYEPGLDEAHVTFTHIPRIRLEEEAGKCSLIMIPGGEKMGFHEHTLFATLLLIVVWVFTFISKIMENSLQNYQDPCIELFHFQIDVFMPGYFCLFFPPFYLQQVLRDSFISKSW